MTEHDFGAHYRCSYCHVLRPAKEIIFNQGKPYCSPDCMKAKPLMTDRYSGGLISNRE